MKSTAWSNSRRAISFWCLICAPALLLISPMTPFFRFVSSRHLILPLLGSSWAKDSYGYSSIQKPRQERLDRLSGQDEVCSLTQDSSTITLGTNIEQGQVCLRGFKLSIHFCLVVSHFRICMLKTHSLIQSSCWIVFFNMQVDITLCDFKSIVNNLLSNSRPSFRTINPDKQKTISWDIVFHSRGKHYKCTNKFAIIFS